MEHREEDFSSRNGESARNGGRPNANIADAAAEGQRSSFYERAARRMGARAESAREWHEQRRDDRDGGRQRGFVEGYRYNEGYPPSGGFGQGGYGSYGGQAGSNWGNEQTTLRGRPEHRDWTGGGEGQPTGFGANQDRDRDGGDGRRANSLSGREPHETDRDRAGRGRWQREVMTAGEIMTSNVRSVAPETTLDEVARIMRDENVGVVPVIDARRRLVGMVTDRDLVVRGGAEGRGFTTTRVADVMTQEIDAVTADEPVKDVIDLMGKKQVRRVPVVDRDDHLIGIIAMADIANRADFDEQLQDALERVSSRRSFWSRFF